MKSINVMKGNKLVHKNNVHEFSKKIEKYTSEQLDMQVPPSSISIPLHDPFGSGTHSHKLVAFKITKGSLARIYPATSGNDFFFSI